MTDCIESAVGGLLREIMKKSIPENVADCWSEYDFGALWESRLHWSGCPSCRPMFSDVPNVFAQIGIGLENRCRDVLSYFMEDYLSQKNSLLAGVKDLRGAYPKIIALWAGAEGDVFPFLAHGQEAVTLRASSAAPEEPEASLRLWEPKDLSTCREFFCSLTFDVQRFVFAAIYCHDLLMPVYQKMGSEHANRDQYYQDLQQSLEAAIANSELASDVLYDAIEMAATGYSILMGGRLKRAGVATVTRTDPHQTLTPQETKTIQSDMQELKRDFDNSVDSLKAGQMELMRENKRTHRPASSYEPYIAEKLGASLYSRLHKATQRALQLAEYFYQANQEPDGFSLTAVRMAQGYENELALRVIWPFVNELLAAGTQTYDTGGISKEPLIRYGKVRQRGMTLGTLAWYLGKDPVMRSRVLGLGFNAEAISKDATWVSDVRNKAAHDFTCDRGAVDELRLRILCPGGILSRLHPS